MRVQVNKIKAEARLNQELGDSELIQWNVLTQRINGEHPVNGFLSKLESAYNDFRIFHARSITSCSPSMIKDFILGEDNKQTAPEVSTYLDRFYNKSVEHNSQMAVGTKKNYRKAIRHLKKFLEHNSLQSLTVDTVNYKIANDFKTYLLSENVATEKVGMTEPSALGNIKKFRTIFDYAVEEGFLPSNPFKRIKLKNQSPAKDRLTIHQVKKLKEINLKSCPTQELYRDIFLFSVYTGLSYVDYMNLKPSNLSKCGMDTKLSTKRQKNGQPVEQILPKQAIEIIDKYRDQREVQISNSILPKRSSVKVNVQLKILGGLAEIPFPLTSNIGRHTHRQLLAEADITELAVIKLMRGQTYMSDIDGVYYKVTESRLIEAKRKFEVYLEKNLCAGEDSV